MKLRSVFIPILLMAAFMFIRCASEAAPGGGPPDTTPPYIINANIISGATHIPVDQEITLYFSENLNPDNIEKNVMIFPISEEKIKVRARGRSLSVSPGKIWDPSIVYTLIFGKGIGDIRGNSIKQPIQISFTSGEQIPQNMIKGVVLGLSRETSATVALSRKHTRHDSIIMSPEYFTQTGPDGGFSFEYLPAETFYIAAYIDLDKSNSYKEKFDGVCIPEKPAVLPDTSSRIIFMEALYDNFLPGKLIKAETLDPLSIELSFSKTLGKRNSSDNFMFNMAPVDTILIKNNTCTLYHQETQSDSISLAINDLIDQVGVRFIDSVTTLPSREWPDSFFHFEQMGNTLRITPDPLVSELDIMFQGDADTSIMSLKRKHGSFYEFPHVKNRLVGTCLLNMPYLNARTIHDSTYVVSVSIEALPEYGAVIGTLDIETIQNLYLVLHNDDISYELGVKEKHFVFEQVLPGSYALSYYIDMNNNGFRDLGRLYPHRASELLRSLDEGIDVRARWDTDLEEPLKIVIEIDK